MSMRVGGGNVDPLRLRPGRRAPERSDLRNLGKSNYLTAQEVHVERPFQEPEGFRLGVYEIIEEKDDYLICKGYDPNALPIFGHYTPTARQKINIAKPVLLQRTPWDGETVSLIVDGTATDVTFDYDDNEPGKRTASATVDQAEVEEVQRITMDYFPGDTITAVQMKKNKEVDGIDDAKTDQDGRLTWVDLNFSGRCWAKTDEDP